MRTEICRRAHPSCAQLSPAAQDLSPSSDFETCGCSVAFQLQDTDESCGGYVCIPGSHKASLSIPGVDSGAGDFSGQGKGLSVHPEPLFDAGVLQSLTMKKGDVLLFLGASQSHAALRWASPVPRRVLLFGVFSRAHDRALRKDLGPKYDEVLRSARPRL